MARPIRVEYANAVYHVTARGNERKAIYRDDADRQRFLETVEEAVERFGVVIHAYCLMRNHYPLLLQTPRANLSAAAGWLQTTYSVRFERRHRRADAQEVSRVVGRLVAEESDRRVAIWLRVRLGGERMTAVAADYGYRDGSGVHRVVQRLDEKAKGYGALARRLQALAREVSSVKS